MPWLCQCGNGNLCEPEPPAECPVCGFDFTALLGHNTNDDNDYA